LDIPRNLGLTYQITGCHNPEQKSLYPEEGSTETQRNTLVHNILILHPTCLRLRSSHHHGDKYKRTYIHTHIVKQHIFFYEFRRCGSVRFTLYICSRVSASLMMVRSAPKHTGVNTTYNNQLCVYRIEVCV
jgi:hypothetical protein